MKSRRKFTKDFKETAARRLNSGQSVAEVARALEVHPSDLHRWRRELQDHGERAFMGAGKKRSEESRVGHANIQSTMEYAKVTNARRDDMAQELKDTWR